MVGGGGAPEQGERMFEETGLRPGELSLDYQSEASCDGAPSADSDAEDSAEGGDDNFKDSSGEDSGAEEEAEDSEAGAGPVPFFEAGPALTHGPAPTTPTVSAVCVGRG